MLLILVVILIVGMLIDRRIVGSSETTIERVYADWSVTKQRLDMVRRYPKEQQYEVKNILERWILMGRQRMADPEALLQKMKSEFTEKKIDPWIVAEWLEVKASPARRAHGIFGSTVFYGDYERELMPERLKILRLYAPDEYIIETAMRYSSIVSTSQHWNMADRAYDKLAVKNAIECFASPFNSQLLRHGGYYCSLFAEDKPFHSLGNFFDCNFEGKIGIANPPFTESFMLDMVNYMHQCLDRYKCTFIVFVPRWRDAAYHIKLLDSPYRRQYHDLPPMSFCMQDSSDGEKLIPARFAATLVVLGGDFDLSEFLEAFKP